MHSKVCGPITLWVGIKRKEYENVTFIIFSHFLLYIKALGNFCGDSCYHVNDICGFICCHIKDFLKPSSYFVFLFVFECLYVWNIHIKNFIVNIYIAIYSNKVLTGLTWTGIELINIELVTIQNCLNC